tara:strand:- start:8837 stop:9256 length:420 start_codon:yes stop_codon:yes gene_type:complete
MSFSNDIRKFADKAKIGYNEAVGGALLGVSRSVILMTPVDEGRARGNWFASLSSYPTTTSENTSLNFSQVEAVTNSAAGEVFFLTNNLPYIGKLEFGGYPSPSEGSKTVNGFSTQAPSGMVRISIENFDQMLKKSASEI